MNLQPYLERIGKLETMQWAGQVTQLTGLLIESKGPAAAIGDFCEIATSKIGRAHV